MGVQLQVVLGAAERETDAALRSTEREAAEAETQDPSATLMERAQLLWHDLGMDLDGLLLDYASPTPPRRRSPSPAPPSPSPLPCTLAAMVGHPKHQGLRPTPLIIANSNTVW